MNDIDRYLDQACRQVSGPDSLRQHLRKELKEHLEEAIDAMVAEGMSQDEATAKAIEDLGDPEMIRDGMQSVHGPGITSLFVEQAIKWKDKRWHLTAQIGLALIIAMLPAVSYFLMILVAPKVEKIYEGAGMELPVYYQGMKSVAVFLYSYFLGLILLVAVVGWLFEWKCKSEKKPLIRTVMFVGLSLISANGAFWIAFVYISSLIDIAVALAARSG
jgi:type II secretory pathway component PulF